MLRKAPICKLSRSKAPKHSKLAVTDIRQKPVDFFNNTTRAPTLALAIIFKTQVSLQKFPFLVTYTISWFICIVLGVVCSMYKDDNSSLGILRLNLIQFISSACELITIFFAG